MSEETYRNTPDWSEEHIKADVRGTVWCGLRYDVSVARQTERSGKPECAECRAVANGEAPIKTPRPLFGRYV